MEKAKKEKTTAEKKPAEKIKKPAAKKITQAKPKAAVHKPAAKVKHLPEAAHKPEAKKKEAATPAALAKPSGAPHKPPVTLAPESPAVKAVSKPDIRHAPVKMAPHHTVVEKEKHAAVKPAEKPAAAPAVEIKKEKPKIAPQPPAPAPKVTPAPAPKVTPAPAVKIEAAPAAEKAPAAAVELKEIVLDLPISVKDLSIKLGQKPSSIIKDLMAMRVMAGINQTLKEETVKQVCAKYGFRPTEAPDEEETALRGHARKDETRELKFRSPIVTFMGHVDHGKTSLLDAIRKSNVVDREFGGITQHIGAYTVVLPKGKITFLDTPGHEAFTAMRARGAKATDIVVLVVAADDGIMPQTQEAIDHARAAGVTIIVALNKIDKPQADPDRVKKQLAAVDLNPEDWGGKTVTVPVSAKTGQGIDTLLEMILLESELLELKANPDRAARGVVLEGKMVKHKGPVATLLVQNGTLHLNSSIMVGNLFGKIRAMFNDRLLPVTAAGPSTPVEVLGIDGVPEAGEQFFVIEDEKVAKDLVLKRQEKQRLKQMQPVQRLGLEDLYSQIKEGKIKELNIVLKADAQGSIEAIKESLNKIPSNEVKINLIHGGIGNINSSDVILAVASNALILGFNVVIDEPAKAVVEKEGQEVRIYNIIYELVNEIRAALEGMLAPKLKKVFLGRAEIRKIFKLSSGIFAGCYVSKGKFTRSAQVSLVRNGSPVFEGELSSLKRFKDDVREVEEGFECGMSLKGFNDIQEGDVIEAFTIQKIARTLE